MWPEWRYTFRKIKGIHFKVMAINEFCKGVSKNKEQ